MWGQPLPRKPRLARWISRQRGPALPAPLEPLLPLLDGQHTRQQLLDALGPAPHEALICLHELQQAGALVEGDLAGPPSLTRLYHEQSKLDHAAQALEPGPVTAPPRPRRFADAEQVALPDPHALPPLEPALEAVLLARRTCRSFEDRPLPLEQLSRLLQLSYGVTGQVPGPDGAAITVRAAPSAGPRYPAEVYLWARQVERLAPGLYHYHPPDHLLERLAPGLELTDQALAELHCGQPQAQQAAVTLILTGVLSRSMERYGPRGYRYVLLDLGHLAQNTYLAGAAMGLGVMASCGFVDDQANRLLGLDGSDETTLYMLFVGPKT